MYSVIKEKIYSIFEKHIRKAYAIGYRYNRDSDSWKKHGEISYSVIMPTKDEWYADPFPFIFDEKHYIFVEIMKNGRKGTIGYTCLETDEGKIHEIIREPFHMSYPNVFEYEEEIYMIPETNQANQIRLYRALVFPEKWECCSILYDGICCVDTSLYFENNKIFAETWDQVLEKNRFFILNMNDFEMKEIVSNNKFVDRRPGGNFIKYKNGVFHALQNCDGAYGRFLHIAKVESFDENGLNEKEIDTLKLKDVRHDGEGFFNRVHTFNRVHNFEVIDFHLYQFRF